MRFARGDKAWGMCDRCGRRALLNDLVPDGRLPSLRVHRSCYDEPQPQEQPINMDEGIILKNPRPDRDDDSTLIDSGTATAGGASTITLPSSTPGLPALYENTTITLTGGTGSGQSRTISRYDVATRQATVSVAWTTPPDATSTYTIASPILSTAMGFTNSFGGGT